MSSQLYVYRKCFSYYYYWHSAEHYRVPSFYSLFSQLNTENKLHLSKCFFYLSLTHAPIFHWLMLRVLWMQQIMWRINLATFQMIVMSSARSASILSMVKSKQTPVTAATLIPPLTNLDPTSYSTPCKPTPLNPLLILWMCKLHRCRHIKHEVWITLRAKSPAIQMRQKCVKTAYK